MSLITLSPTSPAPTRAVEPVVPPKHIPIIVDAPRYDVSALRGVTEGTPIVVDWYQKLKDKISGTYAVDSTVSSTIDQLLKINRLEVRLDGEIDYTQNDKDKTFLIKGELIVTNGLVPNEGDCFRYEAGNGRSLIYTINSAVRTSAMDEGMYRCSFSALFYTSDARYRDLESKVVDSYHYVRDYATLGRSAVVTTEFFSNAKELHKIRHNMAQDYLREFVNHDHKLLLVPSQSQKTYDPYTAHAFRAAMPELPYHKQQAVKFHDTVEDGGSGDPTIWDALLERRADLLVGCRTLSYTVNVGGLVTKPILRSIRYCGANYLVFPVTDNETSDVTIMGTAFTPEAGTTPTGPLDLMLQKNPVQGARPATYPPSMEGRYVLSPAFYNRDEENMSLLEWLTWNYLDGNPSDMRALLSLVSNYRAWPDVRRYYYTPLLMILMNAALQEGSTAIGKDGDNR